MKYDTQITIKRKTTVQDPTYGEHQITWVPLEYLPGSPLVARKFFAEVVPFLPKTQGSESVQGGISMGNEKARIRMRYRADVTGDMQITTHVNGVDTVYEIIAGPIIVATSGRNREIEMMIERFTTTGVVK